MGEDRQMFPLAPQKTRGAMIEDTHGIAYVSLTPPRQLTPSYF
ncbi:hypothetical protein VCHA29O37_460049 [Vibrio chagasii]|nr:hypothetical protein VCHA29O37_460049 [Vibrio chagasii]